MKPLFLVLGAILVPSSTPFVSQQSTTRRAFSSPKLLKMSAGRRTTTLSPQHALLSMAKLNTQDEGDDNDNKYRRRRSKKKKSRRNHRGAYRSGGTTLSTSVAAARQEKREWLQTATTRLVTSPVGSLEKGKWHEVVSMIHGWKAFAKSDRMAPLQMEVLLKRLLQEDHHAPDSRVELDVSLYNVLLDAWACAALFATQEPSSAGQRAREILVRLQEQYELSNQQRLKPNRESFSVVLHAVSRMEGPVVARKLLAWMEHLYKTGKNLEAKPSRVNYLWVLEGYASSSRKNAGKLADGLLSHMKVTGIVEPDTYFYNIAMKSWTTSKGGREAAEHAERILDQIVKPDLFSYTTAIAAWSASGMKSHAVSRAEALLRRVENDQSLEPNTVMLNALMSTWVKSKNLGAVNRTGEILQTMEKCPYTQPDLISYNTHLHALAIHSKQTGYANVAEDILSKLENNFKRGLKPNLFSYNLVIDAHARSEEPEAAVRAASVLRKLIRNPEVQPDTFSFNQVLAALSKSTSPNAAQLADDLLQYMENGSESGIFPRVKLDDVGYTNVIVAYSRSSTKGAAEKAEVIFNRFQDKYMHGIVRLKPSRIFYNAMIDCWAKSKEGTLGARKAEMLLCEMEARYAAGDTSMQPNIVTYNSVLNAWASSGTRCCGLKAEVYLNKMWELYRAGNKMVKPDHKSYNTVINAISKSKNKQKAQKALRVLRRMDILYRAGDTETRPSEVTYTAVLKSCAFPAAPDQRTRRKALDTAIFTLEELQSSQYAQPNQITYGTFMRACANLLHDDEVLRGQIIEKVFLECCEDGQVGEFVLHFLGRAAPRDLYAKLLSGLASSETKKLSVEDLPTEWRCNVQEMRYRL